MLEIESGGSSKGKGVKWSCAISSIPLKGKRAKLEQKLSSSSPSKPSLTLSSHPREVARSWSLSPPKKDVGEEPDLALVVVPKFENQTSGDGAEEVVAREGPESSHMLEPADDDLRVTEFYYPVVVDSDHPGEDDMPASEDQQKQREVFPEDRVVARAVSEYHLGSPAVESHPPQGEGEKRDPSSKKWSPSVRIDEPGPSNASAGDEGETGRLSPLIHPSGHATEELRSRFDAFFALLCLEEDASVAEDEEAEHRKVNFTIEEFEISLDLEDYVLVPSQYLLRDMNTSCLPQVLYRRLTSAKEGHSQTLREVEALRGKFSSTSQHSEELSRIRAELEETQKLGEQAQSEASKLRAEATKLEEA